MTQSCSFLSILLLAKNNHILPETVRGDEDDENLNHFSLSSKYMSSISFSFPG